MDYFDFFDIRAKNTSPHSKLEHELASFTRVILFLPVKLEMSYLTLEI